MEDQMELGKYLDDVETAASFAKKLGKTPVQISHWKTGHRPVPVEHCAEIERVTSGLVTRKDLRPLDWHLIWPELASIENSSDTEATHVQ
jgi:DNA-binding transcriptional regulator YdaS (Cro superfamily)